MIFLHYDENTGEFKGFYDDKVSLFIPTPNIEINAKDHLKHLNSLNKEQNQLTVIDGKVVASKRKVVLDWKGVRYERNLLLNQSDWTQLSDVPADLKAKWATYRQALRDLPETYENSEDVKWPKPPA